MAYALEIVLPLCNPKEEEVLEKTVGSLLAQTDHHFSVLVSDNFSVEGNELIAGAESALKQAGLVVRLVRPPKELGSVEHWNWTHDQAVGQWIKPMASGDELAPEYISRLRAAARDHPSARCVFANFFIATALDSKTANFGWLDGMRSPADSRRHFLANGMPVGPLTTAAYQREAYMALGGLGRWRLSVAQQVFAATLAMSFDTIGLKDPLCHPAQPGSDVSRIEMLAGAAAAGYHAWTEGAALSKIAIAQLIWRAARGRALEYSGG